MATGRVESVYIEPSRLVAGNVKISAALAGGPDLGSPLFEGTAANAETYLVNLGMILGTARKGIRQGRESRGICLGVRTAAIDDVRAIGANTVTFPAI